MDGDFEDFEQRFYHAVEEKIKALEEDNAKMNLRMESLNRAYKEVESDSLILEEEIHRYERLSHRHQPQIDKDYSESLTFKKYQLEKELEVREQDYRKLEQEMEKMQDKVHRTMALEDKLELLKPQLAIFNSEKVMHFVELYRIKKNRLAHHTKVLKHLKKAKKTWRIDFIKNPILNSLVPKLQQKVRMNQNHLKEMRIACQSICRHYKSMIPSIIHSLDQVEEPDPSLKYFKFELLLLQTQMEQWVLRKPNFEMRQYTNVMNTFIYLIQQVKSATDRSLVKCHELNVEMQSIQMQIDDIKQQNKQIKRTIQERKEEMGEKMLESVHMEFEIDHMEKEIEKLSYQVNMKQLERGFLDQSISQVKQGIESLEKGIQEQEIRMEREKKRKRQLQPLSDIGNLKRDKIGTPTKKKKMSLAERALADRAPPRRTRV